MRRKAERRAMGIVDDGLLSSRNVRFQTPSEVSTPPPAVNDNASTSPASSKTTASSIADAAAPANTASNGDAAAFKAVASQGVENHADGTATTLAPEDSERFVQEAGHDVVGAGATSPDADAPNAKDEGVGKSTCGEEEQGQEEKWEKGAATAEGPASLPFQVLFWSCLHSFSRVMAAGVVLPYQEVDGREKTSP